MIGRRPALGATRLRSAAWRVAVVAAVLSCTALLAFLLTHRFGAPPLFDFRGDLYDAGRAILHGHSPYHPAFLAAEAAIERGGGASATTFAVPVYTAPALVAAVPFSLLPFWLAGALFTLGAVAAFIGGLRLLGVRDWRCHALALISWPALLGLYFGTLGPLLVLGCGVAWHWRDRARPAGLAVALLVVAKLFPWPLLVWLLVTRRWRALYVAGGALALAVVAWAAIDLPSLAAYPRMLANLAVVEQGKGTSLVALLHGAGVATALARTLALVAAASVLAAAWWAVARAEPEQRDDGARRALGLVVVAALIASPIVWEHYLVLLFIPVALLSPRLSALWFVPLLTGLVPTPRPDRPAQMGFWLALELVVLVRLLCPGRPGGAPVGRRLRVIEAGGAG